MKTMIPAEVTMSQVKMMSLGVLTTLLLAVTAERASAQVWTPYTAHTVYVYDGAANLLGARVTIVLPRVNRFWTFALDRAFLDMPVLAQLNVLDFKFGLGTDRPLVGQVLLRIRQQRLLTGR